MEKVPWYVKPDIERVNLPDDEWVEVKRELTIGEQKSVASKATKYVRIDGEVVGVLDGTEFDTELLLTYLVGWSATDENGVSLPLTKDALLAQSKERYQVIAKAVSKVVDKRGTEKNGRSSGKKPSS